MTPAKNPLNLSDFLKPGNNNLDLIRLIAAFAVIFGHAYALRPSGSSSDPLISILKFDYSGSLAVKVFFFISGMLVMQSFLKDRRPWAFLTKRIFRIFPALIVCNLLTVFVLGPIFTTLYISEYLKSWGTYKYLINNSVLTDIQWWLPGVFTGMKYAINGSLWTLPHEWMCYLFLAIFGALGFFKNYYVNVVTLATALLFTTLYPASVPTFSLVPDAAWLPTCFLLGALFTMFSRQIVLNFETAFFAWCLWFVISHPVASQFIFYVAIFYTILLVSAQRFVISHLRLPFDASYGVYLYGFPIQQAIYYVHPGSSVLLNQILSMLFAFMLGTVSVKIVERPAIEIGRRVVRDGAMLLNGCSRVAGDAFRSFILYFNRHASDFKELSVYFAISFFVYWAVLKFIFPGYFSPSWPHHSDFYLPQSLRAGPIEALKYLSWPRPAGIYTLALLGNLNLNNSIIAIIAVININASLSVFIFRRALGIPLSISFVIVSFLYFYLIYSSPSFYVFYSQDIWAQTSFLALALGGSAYYLFRSSAHVVSLGALFLFSLFAFLSKETYALSALVICAGYVVFSGWGTWLRRMLPGVTITFALFLSLALGVLTNSVFLGRAASPAYHVSLSIGSVLREWWRYASGGVNLLSGATIILALAAAWTLRDRLGRGAVFKSLCCVLAGSVAWLPNATLPNHYFFGYSWNGAYILFLPCLLLTAVMSARAISRSAAVAGIACALASPYLHRTSYATGRWTLLQEDTQRNLWRALRTQMRTLPIDKPVRVLVTGLTFPFSPFEHPRALDELTGSRQISFDVVEYPGIQHQSSGNVKYIFPPQLDLVNYDEIWMFAQNGQFIQAIDSSTARKLDEIGGISAVDYVVYPRLFKDVLSTIEQSKAVTTDTKRDCLVGNIYMSYLNYPAATQWYQKCVEQNPSDPYVWFGLGNALKAEGKIDEAAHSYGQAVLHDDRTQPNPYFESGVQEMKARMKTENRNN